MLCGHEQEEYPFHTIDDLTPTLRRSESNTSSGQRSRLLADTENKSPINAPDDRTSVSTLSSVTVAGGAQGSSMVSGLSQSSSSSTTNGFDHDSLQGSISNGTLQGDKKEDRQSTLEKKYKVEKVKPASIHLSSHPSTSSNHLVPVYPDGKYEDNSVPFPRTCGATFSSNDRLVMFCVPQSLKKMDQESSVTPRSLSDLVRVTTPNQWMRPQHPSMFASLFGSPPPPSPSEGVSISDFFTEKHQHHHYHRKYSSHKSSHHTHGHSHSHGRSRDGLDGKKDRDRETADRAKKRLHKVAKIEVYNVTAIIPFNLYLAKNYKVDLVDFKGCCEHNAKVASKINRMDLVQMWNVVSLVLESHRRSSGDDSQQPVALKPFGRPLVEKYLKHFEKYRDVQTMAMMACMFWDRETRPRDLVLMMRNSQHGGAVFSSTTTPSSTVTSTHAFPRPDSRLSFEGVNVETTALGTSNDSGWEMLMSKSKRSRSLSESFDDLNAMDKELGEASDDREMTDGRDADLERINNNKILNPQRRAQYEQIKRAYANILYKWGLLNQRTQVLKHTVSLQSSKKIEFSIPCSNCSDTVMNVQCHRCRYPSLNCAICHVGVRGPANVCTSCGHGGHSSHMMDWFHTYTQCPSGCGCNCLQEAPL